MSKNSYKSGNSWITGHSSWTGTPDLSSSWYQSIDTSNCTSSWHTTVYTVPTVTASIGMTVGTVNTSNNCWSEIRTSPYTEHSLSSILNDFCALYEVEYNSMSSVYSYSNFGIGTGSFCFGGGEVTATLMYLGIELIEGHGFQYWVTGSTDVNWPSATQKVKSFSFLNIETGQKFSLCTQDIYKVAKVSK